MYRRVAKAAVRWGRDPYFGFVPGPDHLPPEALETLRPLVGVEDGKSVERFEEAFASLIGEGECVSFAAARMGFHSILRVRGVGPGDEVVLPGATCSVMVNAVLRVGAKPVFADIDPETFGSSAEGIEKVLSDATRVVVAQHSFGIPCDIAPIVRLARERGLFLVEDCALALDSRRDGRVVGSFGDAAIFSTDHSKPLNTIIGGLLYSTDPALIEMVRRFQREAPPLSPPVQWELWRRLLLERSYCTPSRYGRMEAVAIFESVRKRLLQRPSPVSGDDASSSPVAEDPFYPAKMPPFLARLGVLELGRWQEKRAARRRVFGDLLEALRRTPVARHLPAAYADPALEITPLRLVWSQPDGDRLRGRMERFLEVGWTWFMTPIVSTREPLTNYGYVAGSCPLSERLGSGMVNLPCILPERHFGALRERVIASAGAEDR